MINSHHPQTLWLLLFPFMTVIPHGVPLCRLLSSLYLNTQPFAQGGGIFSSGKKMYGAYLPPFYHQTVKKHLCRLNLSHICVLIIDSLLYRQQNATEITQHCGIDGMQPSPRLDRLSHLITTLKHWEEGERGGGEGGGVNMHSTPVPQKVFLC